MNYSAFITQHPPFACLRETHRRIAGAVLDGVTQKILEGLGYGA